MTDQPTNLLHFDCGHCATVLTVPQSMAGVTGPCPSCSNPVTAPSAQPVSPSSAPALVTAPEAAASTSTVRARVRSRRPLAYAGLCAAVAGVAWSAWHFRAQQGSDLALTPAASNSAASVAPAPADPRVAALARSTEAVKKFLATSEWSVARSMIATQDTPGEAPSPAYLPGRFQPLVTDGKFNPVSVATKENAGQYQVVWEIENPRDAEKLVMTADDTSDGVRIRWYQPPYFIASQQGTNASAATQAIAQVTPPPAAAPPIDPAQQPTTAPAAAPEPSPAAQPTEKETILAAIDVPPAPSNGSAPLNNAAAKSKPTTKGTASTNTPKTQPKPTSAPQ